VTPKTTATISAIDDNVGIVTGPLASGGLTDDTRLALRGTLSAALAGAQQLRLYDGSTFLGTARVSGSTWTFDDTRTLAHGASPSYTARVAADASGTAALGTASAAYRVTVDTAAPSKTASITGITDDVGPVQGTLASGDVTDDTKLALRGSLSASLATGETLRVHDGTVFLGLAKVSGTTWTFDDTRTLASGQAVSYTVRVADAVGNESAASSAYRASVDTAAPTKTARISTVTDDQGIVRGAVADGGASDDASLGLSGTLSAALARGETLRLFDQGTFIGTASVNGTGWAFTDTRALAHGQVVSYTARVASAAGLLGAVSNGYAVNIDTSAPTTTAVVRALVDDVGPVQGTVAQGGTTDDTRLALSGTLGAALGSGETLRVFDGSTLLGTALHSGTTWAYTDTRVLTNGQKVAYTARVADAAGNLGAAGTAYGATVVLPLPTPSITAVVDDAGLFTGRVDAGGVTDDNSLRIDGTLAAALASGQSLQVFDGTTLLGRAQVNTTDWRFADTRTLPNGHKPSYTARVVDAAGGVVAQSAAYAVTVDTAAPTASAAVTAVIDDVGPVKGRVASGGTTDDTSLALSGTLGAALGAGETVRVFDGGTLLGTAQPSGTTWAFTDLRTLTNGQKAAYTARVADAAGNLGAAGSAYGVTVSVQVPTPSITSVIDDVGIVTGRVGAGATTDDTRLLLDGVVGGGLVSGQSLRVYDGTALLGTAQVSGTTWTFADSRTLTHGKRPDYTARVVDAAGGTVAQSMAYSVLVDTAAPTVRAAVTAVMDDVGPVKGRVEENGSTDDASLSLSGTLGATLAAGDTVRVYDGSTLLGTAQVSGTTWTFTDPRVLGNDVDASYRVAVADAAGNLGPRSDDYKVGVEYSIADVRSVALSGATGIQNRTLNAGDVVKVSVTFDEAVTVVTTRGTPTLALDIGGTTVLAAYEGGTGTAVLSFTYTVLAGQNDANGISIAANALALNGGTIRNQAGIDARLAHAAVAGNAHYLVDTVAPSGTPAAAASHVDNVGAVQGSASTATTTDDATPGLSIGAPPTGAAGAVLYVDGVETAATLAAGVLTPDSPLAAGTRALTYAWVDAAGNVGARSAAYRLTVDTATPAVSSVGLTSSTGAQADTLNAGDTVTATVVFTGAVNVTGAPTLALDIGGTTVRARYAGGSGGTALTFTYTVTGGLNDADGVSVPANALALDGGTIRSAAGAEARIGHAAVAGHAGYRVDTAAPVAGSVLMSGFDDTGVSATDGVSSDNRFELTVSGAETGATVAFEVSTDGGAGWTGTPAAQSGLADGSYLFRAVVSDSAGNRAVTDATALTVDRTAPLATPEAVTSHVDDAGPATDRRSTAGLTDDATPGLNVGAMPGDASTAWLYVDGVLTAATLAGGVLTPTAPLAEGLRSLRHAWADAAGNVGAQSAAYTLTVDTTGAAVTGVTLSGAGGIQNHMLNAGDVLTATVTFDEEVNVATAGGTPTLALDIGGTLVQAVYGGGSGTTALSFIYKVAAGLNDADGVSIAANALAAGGGTIRNLAGGDAALGHAAVADDARYGVDTLAPEGVPEAITSHADDAGAMKDSRSSASVTDDATPGLNVGVTPVDASTAWLYVDGVLTAATLAGGVLTPAAPLAEGLRSLRYAWADAAGNVGALSEAYALSIDTAFIDRPVVTSVTLTGAVGRQDDTLGADDSIVATVTFDEGVDVDTAGGVPTLALDIGGIAVQATYTGGSGTTALTFLYTVSAGLNDDDGVSIAADALALAGGTLRSIAGVDARLAHAAVGDNAQFRVDTVAPVAGGVVLSGFADTGASATDRISSDNRFDLAVSGAEAGATVAFEVSTDAGVAWAGTPAAQSGLADGSYLFRAVVSDRAANRTATDAVAVTVDRTAPAGTPAAVTAHVDDVGRAQGAAFSAGLTDDATPGLKLGVVPGDASTAWLYVDGVQAAATLAGGVLTPDAPLAEGLRTLRYAWVDAAGNVGAQSAAYTLSVDTTAAAVTGVTMSGASGIRNRWWRAGDVLTATVTFDEAVTVATSDGAPTLALDVGGRLVQARYESGSGTAALNFTYAVPAGLNDLDGVSIPENALAAGAGVILNLAGADADPAHAAVADDARYRVDAEAPTTSARINGIVDDVGVDTGVVPNGGRTDDTRLELVGELGAALAADEALQVYDGESYLGDAQVDGTVWRFADPRPLAQDQAVGYTARVADLAGNLGTASAPYVATVDLTLPPLPAATVTALRDDYQRRKRLVPRGAKTDDPTPTLEGGLSAGLAQGQQVRVYVNGQDLGAAEVHGTSWSFTPSVPISDSLLRSEIVFSARVVDAAGRLSDVGPGDDFAVLFVEANRDTLAAAPGPGRDGHVLLGGWSVDEPGASDVAWFAVEGSLAHYVGAGSAPSWAAPADAKASELDAAPREAPTDAASTRDGAPEPTVGATRALAPGGSEAAPGEVQLTAADVLDLPGASALGIDGEGALAEALERLAAASVAVVRDGQPDLGWEAAADGAAQPAPPAWMDESLRAAALYAQPLSVIGGA